MELDLGELLMLKSSRRLWNEPAADDIQAQQLFSGIQLEARQGPRLQGSHGGFLDEIISAVLTARQAWLMSLPPEQPLQIDLDGLAKRRIDFIGTIEVGQHVRVLRVTVPLAPVHDLRSNRIGIDERLMARQPQCPQSLCTRFGLARRETFGQEVVPVEKIGHVDAEVVTGLIARAVDSYAKYRELIGQMISALEFCLSCADCLSWEAEHEAETVLMRAKEVEQR